MTAPWMQRRTQFARESTGAPTGRGGRAIRPLVGWSKPSAIAIGMSTTMFSHRICNGFSGTPPAMSRIPATRKIAM